MRLHSKKAIYVCRGPRRWTVILTTEAEAEINALPADIRARFLHLAELLESFGPQHVREPHVKSLGKTLWAMRVTGKDGIARAIYVAAEGRRLVVVRAFIKQTQQTPQREMTLALLRMKGWSRS